MALTLSKEALKESLTADKAGAALTTIQDARVFKQMGTLLMIAGAVALGLFLGGSALWQVPVMLLLVFSALEWALDFCAGCWAYGAWYRAFPPKMG